MWGLHCLLQTVSGPTHSLLQWVLQAALFQHDAYHLTELRDGGRHASGSYGLTPITFYILKVGGLFEDLSILDITLCRPRIFNPCGVGNFGKIWSACGETRTFTKNEEWMNMHIIVCIISHITCSKKLLINNATHKLDYIVLIFRTFLQNVMYVVINKQLIRFRNGFGSLCRLCQGKV